jgi:hypothetical protein
MKYTIPDCGKGVNFDLLPSELEPGMWSSCTNYRFRSGFAELWEGLHLKYNDTGEMSWITPYTTGSTYYAVYARPTGAVAYNGATATDIAPFTNNVVVASAAAVGTTVTITTGVAHGRTTGNTVIVYGFVPTQYNGTHVITVTGATTFTYTAAVAPTASPPTVAGAYSLNSGNGFSGGSINTRYTGGAFNGLCLMNSPDSGLFYWDGNTSNKLRRVPNFSSSTLFSVATAARPFKNFIVVLGQYVNGVHQPQNVAWSDSVSDAGSIPSSFTASDTNQAGETNLTETQGAVVDCLPLGDTNIVYTQDSYYAMQYVGGEQVFTFTRIPGNEGLIASNCVVDTPAGHVFLTPSYDVRLHNGGESKSIALGRVHNAIRNYVNTAGVAPGSFLCVNHNKNEVWVCLAPAGEDYAASVLVWNYVDDTWGNFITASDIASGLAHAAFGLYPTAASTTPVADLWTLNYAQFTSAQSGLCSAKSGIGKFLDVALTGTLTREGLDIGDRDRMKTLQRSRWNIDGTGSATITHGSSKFADTAATYATGVTYTIASTDYCNARATQGRFIALSLSSSALSVNAKVRSIDLDVTPGGTR